MRFLITGVLLLLATVPAVRSAEAPVGLWLSEQRTEAGMGKTLEFSGDGRIRLSQGVVIGWQWVVEETRKNHYTVHLADPATNERVRSVELEVDPDAPQLIETDLRTGDRLKMAFVSKGNQGQEPPFLGRWQFMLTDFGIPAVYEYSDDGWLWLRAPIQADLGTYTMTGNKIIPEWPGGYSPLIEIVHEGDSLLATTPEGAQERFWPPKKLETLTSRSPGPLQ